LSDTKCAKEAKFSQDLSSLSDTKCAKEDKFSRDLSSATRKPYLPRKMRPLSRKHCAILMDRVLELHPTIKTIIGLETSD
jgi:hypothetical protein